MCTPCTCPSPTRDAERIRVAEVARVVHAVGALQRIPQPQRRGVTYYSDRDIWLFQSVFDERRCDVCGMFEDIEEINGGALRNMFPYHEILDENTIAANVHPNCRCYLVRKLA